MNRFEHREEKWAFPFVEYSGGNEDKKRPLIIQLHGAGERGSGGEDLEIVETYGFSEVIRDIEKDLVVVMPQCPEDTFWAARVESIIRFAEQIIKEYNIDEDRVYLTGLSMGGYGTWFTAMARPDMFAAIAPVCGGGMAWNANVLKMPVWAFHGADDITVSPTQTDEMIAKLREFNEDVKYTRPCGVGHNISETSYDAELLEWLLEKRRNRD
ncbi:MAG: prolyl oligopeptidase family serine peptidase [Oscillospiraceae bacterium]|nr:prolyl oligopeptidase family serine peptidase [Oscillospiraceae bacterium]